MYKRSITKWQIFMFTCAVNWIQFCIVSLLHRIWIILNKVQFYIFLYLWYKINWWHYGVLNLEVLWFCVGININNVTYIAETHKNSHYVKLLESFNYTTLQNKSYFNHHKLKYIFLDYFFMLIMEKLLGFSWHM